MDDALRRRTLGDLLRAGRERLDPEQLGVVRSARRRVRGLRREEVAALAGVSPAWLTLIEQGRAERPSRQVLEALARALRLTPAERAHAMHLAGHAPAPELAASAPVTERLERLLAALLPWPAMLVSPTLDVLAWNAAQAALFPPLETLPPANRNLLHLLFFDDDIARLLVDLDAERARVVAEARAALDLRAGDPSLQARVAAAAQASPPFRALWARHEVAPAATRPRQFEHPLVGPLELERTVLAPLEAPGLELVVHAPVRERDAQGLARMLGTP
jgi:transcriptional regulator with XRE-family HTH domain